MELEGIDIDYCSQLHYFEGFQSFFPGQYPICSGGIQPADRGQGEEGEGPPVPLGSGGGGEPGAQRLPEAADHADVSDGQQRWRDFVSISNVFTLEWQTMVHSPLSANVGG